MAAAMCQALPSFYSYYNSKSLFISVSNKLYEKYKVGQGYCRSIHDSFCSLGNCKIHILLIGTHLSQVLKILDKYRYIYQEIDCLYTFFQTQFFSSIVISSGGVSNQLSFRVQHNLRWKGAEKNTKRIKETICSEKVQKTLSKF